MKAINVLSLFDGIATGLYALKKAGIPVAKYFASEIDKFAVAIAKYNHPEIIHLGDVRNIKADNLPRIDLLIGGSPCTELSIAGRRSGFKVKNVEITSLEQYLELKESGFKFEGQSYLFWEYIRLLKETKPRWFLLENVKMKRKWRDLITKTLGVEPIEIDSALVSAQRRKRLYWTNIPIKGLPEDRGILLKDILLDNAPEKYYFNRNFKLTPDKRHIAELDIKGHDSIKRVYPISGKSPTLTTCQGGYRQPKVLLIEDKSYCLTATYRNGTPRDYLLKNSRQMVIEIPTKYFLTEKHLKAFLKNYNFKLSPLDGKSKTLLASYYKQPPHSPYIATDANIPRDKDGLNLFLDRKEIQFIDSENTVRVKIRRLTPVECERLQTLPDGYTEYGDFGGKIKKISDTQRYKCLGNGWTAEVIVWIFSFLKKELEKSS